MPGVGWAAGIERLAMLIAEPPAPPRPVALVPIGEAAEAPHAGAGRAAARRGPGRRTRLFREFAAPHAAGRPDRRARRGPARRRRTGARRRRRCAISTAASRARSRLTRWRRPCRAGRNHRAVTMDRVLESRFDQLLRRHAELRSALVRRRDQRRRVRQAVEGIQRARPDRGRHRDAAPRRGGTRRRRRDGRQSPTIPN